MAKPLYWKSKGPLKTKRGLSKTDEGFIWYDEEIPEEILRDLGSDRVTQLRKKGKIGDKTDEEIAAKVRAKAAKAAKAAISEEPAPRREKVGPKQ